MKSLFVIVSTCLVLTWAKEYCTPSQTCWPTAAEISAFKKSMAATQGRVMTPDEKDWVGPYLTFNQAEAKTPAMVVFLGTVDQIKEALKFAFKYNIKVSIVSSGHSFFGRCGADDSMQISVHYMKGIDIDLNCEMNEMGCAVLQAGVQWGEAYREADKYNRIIIGGSNPTVAVSGWTLGGGHSPLSRSFGLGVHTTLEFHLITADLREVWARSTETVIKHDNGTMEKTNDTSLFYALRGGGSSFGVLVDITVKLVPAKPMVQHVCVYPAFLDGTPRVFEDMYADLTDFLKNAPSTFSGYIVPSVGCDPETKACGGSSVISIIHYGERKDSPDEAWFKKLEELPHKWSREGLILGGCQMNSFKSFYDYELTIPNVTYAVSYIGGNLVQRDLVSDQTFDLMVKYLNSSYHAGNAFSISANWVGGGKAAEIPEHPSAVHKGWYGAMFSLTAGTGWDPQKTSDPSELKQAVRDFHNELKRFSDGMYMNEAILDLPPEIYKKEFWDDYDKLLSIKKAWDPQNKFTCVECVGADWDPENDEVFG